MHDKEKVIKGVHDARKYLEDREWVDKSVGVYIDALNDALALLKEQETTDTGKRRIFQCEKCGYGIDDIYLSNEHDFDIYPHFCPNCGRKVKWDE